MRDILNPMSDVEFDTDIQGNPAYGSRSGLSQSQIPRGQGQSVGSVGMARWLMRHGIIDSESGAKAVLIGIVCVNFVAMALILYFFVL